MTLTDPNLINDVQGALVKLTDANDKLCEVFTATNVDPVDHLQITRSLQHIAAAKQDASLTLPPGP